jgi:hypothetical protein
VVCIASGSLGMEGDGGTYHLLTRLGVEIFAEGLRHCGGWLGWLVDWLVGCGRCEVGTRSDVR